MSQSVPNFPVPAFTDELANILADFAAIEGLDTTLRVGVLPVLALVLAKLAAGEYAYLAAFPNRCLIPTLMKAPYLDVYCGGVGLRRIAAGAASGNVSFSGTNGTPLPVGAQMQDSTGTVTLVTTAAGTWSGSIVTAPVQAVTAGIAGNLAAGAPVTLQVGIAGISATGVVAAGGLAGGTAQEDDAQLQVRLAARLSNPPQGGANADFVAWAKQVPGVTRVYVYPAQNGAGTVVVQVLMDGNNPPLPDSGTVAAVQAKFDALAPVIGTYTAMAPVEESVAVTIQSLTPATGYTLGQAQAAAIAALAALNFTTTPGGYGWDGQAENYLTGGKLFQEQIEAAVANAPGVGTFDLVVPAGDTTAAYGYLPITAVPVFT